MIKQILKIIWAQRKNNGWIFAELIMVVCAVWWMADQFYVDMRTYYSPLGYDIANVWRFNLETLTDDAPEFVSPEEITTTEGDDLLRLQTQIRQHPAVEDVAISFQSIPYTSGSTWIQYEPVDGDTTGVVGHYFKTRIVTPEYFDVFRVKDMHGNDIRPMLGGATQPFILTRDMAEKFFHTADVRGRKVKVKSTGETLDVSAVSQSYRENEYERGEPTSFHILTGADLLKKIDQSGGAYTELAVRMKKAVTEDEMDLFLKEMGERLRVNNLHVYSVSTVERYRENQLRDNNNELSKKMSLLVFLLINVFFGILGTFWLRTQQRQGELGLRIALGATRFNIKEYMYIEGTILLVLTLPVSLVFAFNMVYLDILDNYRLHYTIGRFLLTYGGTYLLMLGMIWFSIWFPVRKAGRMAPAEALHYE